MSAYYYLLSSVPYLQQDQVPGIDATAFIALAEPWMSADEINLLKDVSNNSFTVTSPYKILSFYSESEIQLRLALAKSRSQKLSMDLAFSLDQVDIEHASTSTRGAECVRLSMAADNPLEMEQILDRYRWTIIEDSELGHHFDLESVLAYLLKLTLLDKKRARTIIKGSEQYAAAYELVAKSLPLDLES